MLEENKRLLPACMGLGVGGEDGQSGKRLILKWKSLVWVDDGTQYELYFYLLSFFPICVLNLPVVHRIVQCDFSVLASIFALMFSIEVEPFSVFRCFFLFLG